MLSLESQVTSLELSKKLKELGVEQKSIFVWEYYDENAYAVKFFPFVVAYNPLTNVEKIKIYSAFTASELISLLPNRITLKEGEPFNSFILSIRKNLIQLPNEKNDMYFNYVYSINYECDSTNMSGYDAWLKRSLFPNNICDENFSNALAKTLIYIIENKLI